MKLCSLAVAAALLALPAQAQDIRRVPVQGDFPISSAVVVPPGAEVAYLSGVLPDAANPQAPAGSSERYGSTEAQTLSVLTKLQAGLAAQGMDFGDVVQMRVFLVGDPAQGGRMDFAGMMRAYQRFFGGERQPLLPARTVVQVVGLPAPGALVEIDVVAARIPVAAGARAP